MEQLKAFALRRSIFLPVQIDHFVYGMHFGAFNLLGSIGWYEAFKFLQLDLRNAIAFN